MKKIILALLLFAGLATSAQKKWTPINGNYNYLDSARFDRLKYFGAVGDSILGTDALGNVKLVKSAGGGTPIDTSSLSNRINLKVNISDTAAMLSKYLRFSDTSGVWVNNIYKNATGDSIVYYIGNTRYAVKDSIGANSFAKDTIQFGPEFIVTSLGPNLVDVRGDTSVYFSTKTDVGQLHGVPLYDGDLNLKVNNSTFPSKWNFIQSDGLNTLIKAIDSTDLTTNGYIELTNGQVQIGANVAGVTKAVTVSDSIYLFQNFTTTDTIKYKPVGASSGGALVNFDKWPTPALAGSAGTLTTARTINGTSFNGSASIVTDMKTISYGLMGSTIKAQNVDGDLSNGVSGASMNSQRIYYIAVYLPIASTITGVKFIQITQGNYTANNYNGVGLFTYSAGVLTKVATSTDDGNIWKATAGTMSSKAFSGTYSATAGLYFVGLMYSSSAQVTAPALGILGTAGTTNTVTDFTNSTFSNALITGQTAFPASTQAMSGLTAAATEYKVYLY